MSLNRLASSIKRDERRELTAEARRTSSKESLLEILRTLRTLRLCDEYGMPCPYYTPYYHSWFARAQVFYRGLAFSY
jgi:hypothetical protein